MTHDPLVSPTVRSLLEILGRPLPGGPLSADALDTLASEVDRLVAEGSAGQQGLWLVWAALRGELPIETDIVDFRRTAILNGSLQALRSVGARSDASMFGFTAEIEIVSDAVLVDVHDTSSTDVISGIQRVVRETVRRWLVDHEVILVAWSHNKRSLRRLNAEEEARIRGEEFDLEVLATYEPERIVIPNGGLMIVPELVADTTRADRLLALGRFARTRVSYIGYDCVPLTSGETSHAGIASHFPLYLDAMAYADTVATISESTAHEFLAWKKMLPSSGRSGPDVRAVFLGGDSAEPSTSGLKEARTKLGVVGDEPVVLVVGSHEPRKNHLSVLNVAHRLWRSGVQFRLIMIGAASWNSAPFDQLSQMLTEQGFPLQIVSNASDDVLSAAYRLATVSIFTSFHEGFGLPIVESLKAGTPVIASNVGSMNEIAHRYGGVITVDPHSDDELEAELRGALLDPAVLAAKRTELATNDYQSWNTYADEVWQYFSSQPTT
ncbi:glycosyltransferase [Subtercola sp. RTI3]|uniref:glycosyltransferase n=1 Tax=Subtercola sp. RTI3 TaxID=3048639 RepID=UPI002B228E40|nr:glycosyltransferase [Subtercola sp. RTI3]MEA9984423.1 glycosyltransferase [Subtercola sp. RTI3]